MSAIIYAVNIILVILGTVAIVLTLLPFFRHGAWWIRIGDFPRIQIAFLSLLVSILLVVFFRPLETWEIVFLALLLAAALYQLYCVLPYMPFYPRQVQQSRVPLPKKAVKLLISNVLIENKNPERLLKLVKKWNPDIIVLAEPDDHWAQKISSLEEDYPHTVSCPLDNAYGMMLFSKLKLIEPKLKFLIEDDIPSIHTEVELRSGDVVKLYCLHPRPPAPQESLRSTERDAELLMVGRITNDHELPTIICGDLNDVAWSRTTKLFQKISGLLDPRVGRGLYSSFHADYPIIRFPLDHVFHSNHFRLIELKRLPSIGSDHFPIYISLSYETTAPLVQEEPEADHEDHLEAIETIQEAFELKEAEKADSNI
jgi:endonuclease/exonuclease/phosphatase (EEP) superfamily protein YafD